MVNVFPVVGEHKVDDARLLLLGTDGHYYGYLPRRHHFVPVEPDHHWCVYTRSHDEGVSSAKSFDDEPKRGSAIRSLRG